MLMYYRINECGEAVPSDSFQSWTEETHRVACTPVGDGRVSTVFLGMDHRFSPEGPPILWETMVFDVPGLEYECERYTSRADAEAGHVAWVARALAHITAGV